MVLFGGPCPGFVFAQILDGFSVDFGSSSGSVFDAAVDVFSRSLESKTMLKPSAGAIESHVCGFRGEVLGRSFQQVLGRFLTMVAECKFRSHLGMLFCRFREPIGGDGVTIGAKMAEKRRVRKEIETNGLKMLPVLR